MPSLPPNPRVFVVDDDSGLVRLIRRALQRDGYWTDGAGSGQEAVDWLQQNEADLLLIDLDLPDMPGGEVIRRLEETARAIPFIVITGHGDERVAVEMMKRGAVDYLVKDRQFIEFVPAVVGQALKQIERDKKLAAAEEQIRLVEAAVKQAGDAVLITTASLPRPTIVFVNPAFVRMTGYESDQVVGRDFILLAQIMTETERMLEVFATGLPAAGEAVIQNGGPLMVEWQLTPVRDRDGRLTHWISIQRDSTERKRSELRQRLQYAVTRALAEAGTLAQAAPVILYSICDTLGWAYGELWRANRQTQCWEYVECWHDPKLSAAPFEKASRQLQLTLENGLPGQVWKTGRPVWLADSSLDPYFTRASLASETGLRAAVAFPILLGHEVLAVLAFFSRDIRPPEPGLGQMFTAIGSQIGQFVERKRTEEELRRARVELEVRVQERTAELAKANADLQAEISERKQAAAALRESERRFRAIFNQTFQFVGLLHPNGTLLEANQSALDYCGVTLADVVGKRFWDCPWWADPPENRQRIQAAVTQAAQGRFIRCEIDQRAPDGSMATFDFSLKPVFDEAQKVVLLIPEGRDITIRKRAEKELQQAHDELERRVQERTAELARANAALQADIAERKRLEQEILQISEMEQGRLGQDLHDGLCQHLAGIEFMGQVLQQKLAGAKTKNQAAIAADMTRLVRQAISQTRDLAKGLFPVVVESQGLMSALQELASNTEKLFRVTCHFHCDQPVLVEDNKIATHLYRIAQEAVSNAIRHGQAKHIDIRLSCQDDAIALSIQDNGTGLPPNIAERKGMGLRIMSYRAGMIGATLHIRNRKPAGAEVLCSVPSRSDSSSPAI